MRLKQSLRSNQLTFVRGRLAIDCLHLPMGLRNGIE